MKTKKRKATAMEKPRIEMKMTPVDNKALILDAVRHELAACSLRARVLGIETEEKWLEEARHAWVRTYGTGSPQEWALVTPMSFTYMTTRKPKAARKGRGR